MVVRWLSLDEEIATEEETPLSLAKHFLPLHCSNGSFVAPVVTMSNNNNHDTAMLFLCGGKQIWMETNALHLK